MPSWALKPFASGLAVGALLAVLGSVAEAGTAVTSFTLINADTGTTIANSFQGGTLDLAALPTRNLNIRANTSPSTVGSVRFGLDQTTTYRIENALPYALAGNTSTGGYHPWTPSVGTHTVSATPYSGRNGTGEKGTALVVTMSVVDSSRAVDLHEEPSSSPGVDLPSTLVDSAPVVIDGRTGVTIRGVRIQNPSGRCVQIRNSSNIVVEASEIGPCAGNGVEITNSHNVTVRDNYVHTERSGSSKINTGLGVHIITSSQILVQGNRFERNETSVYGYTPGHSIRVVGNYSLNPLGPYPRGQHVQLWSCNKSGPMEQRCEVSANYGRLDPERGAKLGATHTEDMINIGKSNYALIEDNYLVGGDSPSGCGIIVEGPSSFTTIRDNVVIRTAQCGIGVANADHTLVDGNRVLDTNLVALGLTTGGNIGIYVWRKSDSPSYCYSNTVQRNIVSNRFPDGRYNDLNLSSRCTGTVKQDNITGAAARSLLTPESEKLPPPSEP
jgi:nitrous oxidase accessory protein NosD